jgi:two-component system OmpR family sensor kinase
VVAVPLEDAGPIATLLLASDLGEVEGTVQRLVVLQLAIGLLVLAGVSALGRLLVRSSLRGLVEVEEAAAAVATGRLDRRVPERDPRTEVGSLAASFNRMVTQVQSAFARQEASESRLRRFVADASHELRTPLTSIRGFAELHRQGAVSDPADVTRVMRRIEDEAKRMGLLVEDLLALARLDEQRPLELAEVDLAVLAADAAHDARAVQPERQISVQGDGPLIVRGDAARLRQVLTNLLANALQHTPVSAAVEVRLRRGTGEAVLEVADRGPGMAPEAASRVFERFYRADASRTRASGGSGLGLSIVSALVAAHAGSVELDTAPGQGATFRVRLPLAPTAPGQD